MAIFKIQVQRQGEWRDVTTVNEGSDFGRTGEARRRAILAGLLGVASWRASDQFTGLPLRLVERTTLRGVGGGRSGTATRVIPGLSS